MLLGHPGWDVAGGFAEWGLSWRLSGLNVLRWLLLSLARSVWLDRSGSIGLVAGPGATRNQISEDCDRSCSPGGTESERSGGTSWVSLTWLGIPTSRLYSTGAQAFGEESSVG